MLRTMRSLAILLMILLPRAVSAQQENKLRYYYPVPAQPAKTISADLCVYGGTPGGVAAAVQASRMGKKAILVVFRRHVGGMTSGGLTATDVGRAEAIGGLATEFHKRVGKQRMFAPSKAEEVFRAMLQEAKVPIYFEHRLKEVTKAGNRIMAISAENGVTFQAKMFVDATYEGDLLAKAGVSFHVGREGNRKYGESLNGVQFRTAHNFVVPVDPYRVEGNPKSGLLWGISPLDPGKPGDADAKVQAYNFRMFISHATDRVPYPKPAGYDRDKYLLLLRYLKLHPVAPVELHVGDCNNDGAFSSDYIGANYAWPEGDYVTREKIYQDHVEYQQGFMWFLANDPEVPVAIRNQVLATGLTPGEFPETGGWPHELYVREGRRMVASYVMTEANCLGKKVAEDSVGMASYGMDSHNVQRVVINGKVRNEGDFWVGCPRPYPVSYRSITPHEAECANLLVPVSLSASHAAYGSIRMEPVFMILGESAGTAAALAIDAGVSVQKVDYARLREKLLADQQVLENKTSPAGASNKGPASQPSQTQRRGWLVLALFISGTFFLAVLGIRIMRRQRPQASTRDPVVCPGCGKSLSVKRELAGKKVKCPKCGEAVPFPAAEASIPPGSVVGGRVVAMALVAIFIVAGTIAWWAIRTPQVSERSLSFLDRTFGAQPMADIEESGFHGPEKSNTTAYRWTNGATKLVVPLDGPPPKALQVHLILPGKKGFRVRIHVNGQSLFDDQLAHTGGWKRTFDLSAMSLGKDLTLEILSDSFVPAEKNKNSTDHRILGVRVVGINLLGDAMSYVDVPLGVVEIPDVKETGFHRTSVQPSGPSRWTNGAARLTAPLGDKKPRMLALTLEIPDRPEYRVMVAVNGHKLIDEHVKPNSIWSSELPLAGLDLGASAHIELDSSTFVPAQVGINPKDMRKLGVNVKRLILATDSDAGKK